LVLFLDHQDSQVLLATLTTMRYLAESHININIMKNELGMMVSLENLMERSELSVDISSLAKEVHGILLTGPRTPEKRPTRNKGQFFINSSNKKAKSVTLHINGLDSPDQRSLCEDALLRVKGVISFTFQMASKRCTVRIRSDLPTESLGSAIAATKVLSAQQVVKNEEGEEVLLPMAPCQEKVERNVVLPDYLEEEEPDMGRDRAVSRAGLREDASNSWLSSAATFLTKTFYW